MLENYDRPKRIVTKKMTPEQKRKKLKLIIILLIYV